MSGLWGNTGEMAQGEKTSTDVKGKDTKKLFYYVAKDEYDRLIRGLLMAKDLNEAQRILLGFNYKDFRVRPMSQLEVFWVHFWHRVTDKELAIFTREMAEMFKAGLPIMRVLELLSTETLNPRLSLIAMMAKEYLRNGLPLSKAFAEFPEIFSDLYVGMLRLGEATGEFDAILDELANYIDADYELKARLKSSLVYPAVVIGFAILLVWGLVNFIFPKFLEIIRGLDLEVPFYTKILIQISQISSDPKFIVPAILTLLLVSLIFRGLYRGSLKFRTFVEKMLIRVPVIGSMLRKLLLARFAKAMVLILKSGLPLMLGIDYISYSLGSGVLRDVSLRIREVLREGGTLSQAIEEDPFFTTMFKAVVEAGEQVGELEGMLTKVADLYDFEVKTEMAAFVNLIEPIIIVVLGLVVGFVLLGVFSPLMTLINTIK